MANNVSNSNETETISDVSQPLPYGFPWGLRTVSNTNPYENPPFTGVIRTYDFTISRGNIAPDGVNRSVSCDTTAGGAPDMQSPKTI